MLRGEDEADVERGPSEWAYLLCVNVVMTLMAGREFVCPAVPELVPSALSRVPAGGQPAPLSLAEFRRLIVEGRTMVRPRTPLRELDASVGEAYAAVDGMVWNGEIRWVTHLRVQLERSCVTEEREPTERERDLESRGLERTSIRKRGVCLFC